MGLRAEPVQRDASPFAPIEAPYVLELETSAPVATCSCRAGRTTACGPARRAVLSADGEPRRLPHPSMGVDSGSEIVRSHRRALPRGFSPSPVFDYWAKEPWTGANVVVDDERRAGSLVLVNELLNVL